MGKRRRWGQHFLVDQKVRDAIVEHAALSQEDLVVEIGVGKGFLTEALLLRAGWVVGFEIDPVLFHQARERFKGFANLSLVQADFLQISLPTFLAPFPFQSKKCVSNLPYSLSTAVFLKLFGEEVEWRLILLMVQREFGERVLFFPPEGKGSLVSMAVHLRFAVEKVFYVPPSTFRPQPHVESVVLKFTPLGEQINGSLYWRIMSLGRLCFAQRRKAVLALLSGELGDRGKALSILEVSRVPPHARAEDLTRDQWIALGHAWEAFQDGGNGKSSPRGGDTYESTGENQRGTGLDHGGGSPPISRERRDSRSGSRGSNLWFGSQNL